VKGTMRTRIWLEPKVAAAVVVAAFLARGLATAAISQAAGNEKMTAQEIVEKLRDAYASLSSYSKSGFESGLISTRTHKVIVVNETLPQAAFAR